jgi:hypothetical protein
VSQEGSLNTQPESNSRFDRQSWLVLALALLIVAYGLWQSLYYLSLPTDGWLSDFDPSQANPHYIFRLHPGDDPTPIQAGDILLAIENQPLATIVERALRSQQQRPPSWVAGGTVRYTVLRQGQTLTLDVSLQERANPTLHLGFPTVSANLIALLLVWPVWVIGPAVFFLRPRLTAARMLLLFSVFFFMGTVPLGGWNFLSVMFERPASLTYLLLNAWGIGLLPLLVHLMLVFPEVKKPMRQHPWLTAALIYSLAPIFVVLGAWLSYRNAVRAETTNLFSGIVFLGSLLAVMVAAGHSMLTLRDPVTRAQMRWINFGVLAGFMGGVAIYFLGLLDSDNDLWDVLLYLTIPVLPICLAIAILRYRLFDIDILVRRTLVYGLLTALLALVYFGTVVLLQAVFRTITSQGQSEMVTVLSTLAIAALFTPLRRQVQRFIDRRFYRSQYNAGQTLAAFAATARDEVNLNNLTAELLQVVEATMRPAHVSLWLKKEGRNQE